MPSVARLGAVSLAVCTLVIGPAWGGGKEAGSSIRGVMLASPAGQRWTAVKSGAAVPREQALVVPAEAAVRSSNGVVAVRLVGETGDVGPLPALEAAVRLHDGKDADLELTLERGIL